MLSIFPQCFLPIWRAFCHFYQTGNCRLQTLSVWKSLKIVVWERVNPLSNNKFLEWSKFKQLADDKVNVTEKLTFVLGRIENIEGKGENAGY